MLQLRCAGFHGRWWAVDRSQDWMRDAHADLSLAATAAERHLYNWACFAAQQAAEKAVKAVFARLGAVAWGHAVAGLLRALPATWAAAPELVDSAMELDKVYVGARYPDAHQRGAASEAYTAREARRLIGYAEEIVRFCEDLLSRARPRPGA